MEASTNLGRVSLVPRGEYDPSVQYERLDVVGFEGAGYLVLRPVQGAAPEDGPDYMLLAARGRDGEDGAPGKDGEPGNSIAKVERTGGTGAPGEVDTYTITLTDGSTTAFQVRNGADGQGAGDMVKSVYDPQGKAEDIFSYADAAAQAVLSSCDPAGTAAGLLKAHDGNKAAHSDLRALVSAAQTAAEGAGSAAGSAQETADGAAAAASSALQAAQAAQQAAEARATMAQVNAAIAAAILDSWEGAY